MSSFNRRTLILMPLALAACGFTPAYGPKGPAQSLRGKLRATDPSDKLSFDFVTAVEARFGRATAKAIDEVTRSIETFAFNKAIAALYGLTNTIARANASTPAMKDAIRTLAKLMSPMTPHIAESIWSYQGGGGLCTQAPWPKADPALLIDDTVTLPIQINGKRRAEISVPKDMPASEVEKLALANEDVQKFLAGQPVKKLIVVPGRIINVVV